MVKTIIIALFVSGVILVECLMAYCLIPSTADIEAKAAEHATAAHDEHGHDEHAADEHAKTLIETDIGKFNITIHRPATDVTIRVNFHLIGTVEEEHAADGDHSAPADAHGGGHGGGHGAPAAGAEPTTEAGKLLKKNEHRLRDRIIFEIRNAELSDLTEPGLGLIKRRILEKSNEVLGKPVLQSILFSEFSFTQL